MFTERKVEELISLIESSSETSGTLNIAESTVSLLLYDAYIDRESYCVLMGLLEENTEKSICQFTKLLKGIV